MPTIRSSILSTVPDCALRAASKAFHREIEDAGFVLPKSNHKGVYSPLGTGVHAGACYAMAEKIRGNTPSLQDAIDISCAEFDKACSDSEISYDDTTSDLNEAYHQISVLSKSYMFQVLPIIRVSLDWKPEDRLERKLSAIHRGFEFTGHPDLIGFGVHDTKCATMQKSHHPQTGMYAGFAEAHKIQCPVEYCQIDYLPRTSKKKIYPGAKSIVYDVKVCKDAAFAAANILIDGFEKFSINSDPWSWSCNPSSMLCSKKYCSAHGTDFCPITK